MRTITYNKTKSKSVANAIWRSIFQIEPVPAVNKSMTELAKAGEEILIQLKDIFDAACRCVF